MSFDLTKHNSYIDLVQAFPPRTIKSQEELWATRKVTDALVYALIERGELTEYEKDYLDVLKILARDYEQTQEPIPAVSGVELLKFLMEEHNLRQKDLVSIFKTESIVSDVLNGHRKLTVSHIQELAKRFNVSPAAFMPSSSDSTLKHPRKQFA